jgi:hypothetical protein
MFKAEFSDTIAEEVALRDLPKKDKNWRQKNSKCLQHPVFPGGHPSKY